MTQSEINHWQNVHPEPTSNLITWLIDTMEVGKPYNLKPDQVDRIKDVWEVLSLSDFIFTFNSEMNRIIKK